MTEAQEVKDHFDKMRRDTVALLYEARSNLELVQDILLKAEIVVDLVGLKSDALNDAVAYLADVYDNIGACMDELDPETSK